MDVCVCVCSVLWIEMIPGLEAALAGRKKFVDEASEAESFTGVGTGLSDSIKTAGVCVS